MPFAETSDGARIYHEVYGEGPVLVLIPGIGATSRVWGPFPKVLGNYFRTISFDPRGLGRSRLPVGTPPEMTSLPRMARDVAELVAHAGAERAHILGISLGGIVAQYVASAHPGTVDRLILVNTAGSMGTWTRRIVEIFEILIHRLPPEEYVRVVVPMMLSPAFFRREKAKVADLEERLRFGPESLPMFKAQIRALRQLDEKKPHIGAPTLIIGGTIDLLTPPFCAEEIHQRVVGSKLVLLEGGHSCLMERSEEGLVSILTFLRDPSVVAAPGEGEGGA
jgi:pimeloyl-ACP methyl ester carboxylesterase